MIDDIKGSEQRKKHSNINFHCFYLFSNLYKNKHRHLEKKNTSMVTVYP